MKTRKEYKKDWYISNKESIKKTQTAYREKYKERLKATRRAYYIENRDKLIAISIKYRKANRLRMKGYSLTKYWPECTWQEALNKYEELFTLQNRSCAICYVADCIEFCVDHNHITNEVRGILCHSCNKGLGHFDADRGSLKLQRAIIYLK